MHPVAKGTLLHCAELASRGDAHRPLGAQKAPERLRAALRARRGVELEFLWALLVARALLGLAVAGIMVTVTTLFTDYYEGDKRAHLLGLQGTFMSLSGILRLERLMTGCY